MRKYLHNLWKRIKRPKPGLVAFPEIFEHFQELLQNHQQVMELIADLGEKSGGEYIFDRKYLADTVDQMHTLLLHMVQGLNLITGNRYLDLHPALDRIFVPLESELRGRLSLSGETPLIVSLAEAPLDRPELTGGKANNLAVVIRNLQLPVPPGFIITTQVYRLFLEFNQLEDRIHAWLESWAAGEKDEGQISRQIQYSILAGVVPQEAAVEIKRQAEKGAVPWALRSSAYGDLVMAGTFRRGITDSFTAEVHAEGQAGGASAAGVDTAWQVGDVGILSLTAAAGGDGALGFLGGAGFERNGQRVVWRSTMRVGWSSRSKSRARNSRLRRNNGGAGGCIAAAGDSAAARRTAPIAPSSAAPTLAPAASRNGPAPGRNSRKGNR
mgnify:CR=1 FL=1